jgi:hypothetical protein
MVALTLTAPAILLAHHRERLGGPLAPLHEQHRGRVRSLVAQVREPDSDGRDDLAVLRGQDR